MKKLKKFLMAAALLLSTGAALAEGTSLAETVGTSFASGIQTAVSAQSTNITTIVTAAISVFAVLIAISLLKKVWSRIAGR